MKLDITVLRYLSREDWRVLMSVELGMKNHDLVPTDLIVKISKLHRGGTFKAISNLHKHKLIYHEAKIYDGYRLTYLGYDFLAIKAMAMRDTLVGVGGKCGVGKESDIYYGTNAEDTTVILKLARLGRISFRNIKQKRDYLLRRKSASWLYMSRLAAFREYSYMQTLHEHGLPIPKPLDWSRHCVLMSLVDGINLAKVEQLADPGALYDELMALILKFASFGLIHCDYNEFNIMVSDKGVITVIDFPQMVSVSHENAQWYFERDVECIVTFFARRFNFVCDRKATWEQVVVGEVRLDKLVHASGVNTKASMPTGDDAKSDDEDYHSSDDDDNDNDGGAGSDVVVAAEKPPPSADAITSADDIEIAVDDGAAAAEDEEDPVVAIGAKAVVQIAMDKEAAAEELEHEQPPTKEEIVRNNVRREMRKVKEQKKFQKTKRQGKREKARAGARQVRDYTGNENSGW